MEVWMYECMDVHQCKYSNAKSFSVSQKQYMHRAIPSFGWHGKFWKAEFQNLVRKETYERAEDENWVGGGGIFLCIETAS